MTSPIYLNLGSGKIKIPGFVNVDLDPFADVQADLTKELPWEDRTVRGIYSEHFIEHISQAQGLHFLHECHRIMLPGSTLRIATPDLDAAVQDYVADVENATWVKYGMDWTANRCERLNLAMREWGHQWLYSEEELTRLAAMVGFEVKGRMALSKSDLPQFKNLETRESSRLIMEFVKPDRMVKDRESPLVTIAIPAYKPRYFTEAFASALAQTYGNIEILVCDDCRTGEIEAIVKKMAPWRHSVRYLYNPERLMGYKNLLKCFAEANGEFIKFLNDDDVLAPNCVERMMNCFRTVPDLTLVTSHRQIINAQGQVCTPLPATLPVAETDMVIEGLSLGDALVSGGLNFAGEPSTVMFRKKELTHVSPDFMRIDKHPMRGVNDIATWVHLALRGNTAYLSESLSQFRIHEEQNQIVLGSELAPIAREAVTKLRYFWTRFGLARQHSQITLRCKRMAAQGQPWSYRIFGGDVHSGWVQATATSRSEHTLTPGKDGQIATSTIPSQDGQAKNDQENYALAEQLFKEGKEAEAVDLLISLANKNSSTWQVYNDLGVYAFQKGELKHAEQLLRIALSKEAAPTAAYINLASVLLTTGHISEGKGLVLLYLQHFPDDQNAVTLKQQIENFERVPSSRNPN